jgi:hypothetical protein
MGIFSKPKAPNVTPMQMPSPPDPDKIREDEKNRMRQAMAGRTQTAFTSPLGEQDEPKVGQKTLLGQ